MTVSATVSAAALAGGQALEIARRLLDPNDVLAATPADASLGSGLAGTALLHARLSSVDPMFAAAASRHWTAAAKHAQHRAGGIYTGPGALATSLIIAVPYLPDPGPHRDSVARATAWLSRRALDISTQHQQRVSTGASGTPWPVYDAITGLAGVGRVLLAATAAGHRQAEHGLRAVLHTLTRMIDTPPGDRPGWWLPAAAHPAGVTAHPSGAATTGMAHGIAGVAAFLAAAESAGWAVSGQTAAIRQATCWLLRWRDPRTGRWPPYRTGDELDRPPAGPAAPGHRDAWCYGASGIGAALAQAGRALADPALARTGQAAVAELADRPVNAWDVAGPTLCHGYAGVLQAACRTSAHAITTQAADAIAAAFDASLPFGVPHHLRPMGRHRDDRPGFLTGAAGVALALADYAQLPAPPLITAWDAILLLS